jgi:putative FmdB family regulatory protein
MPTYDYVCRACGAELELFQSITARPRRKCQRCGKNSLERRIGTGAGILFKGSGFYQTDYRSASYSAGQKAESGASGSDVKPAAGSDSAKAKPDSKPDSKPAGDSPAKKKPGSSSSKD